MSKVRLKFSLFSNKSLGILISHLKITLTYVYIYMHICHIFLYKYTYTYVYIYTSIHIPSKRTSSLVYLYSWHKKDPYPSKTSIHWGPFQLFTRDLLHRFQVPPPPPPATTATATATTTTTTTTTTPTTTTTTTTTTHLMTNHPPAFSLFFQLPGMMMCFFPYPAPLGMHKTCSKSMGPLTGETHPQLLLIFFILRQLPSRELTYPLKNGILKMIFLFPRWDMLIPWRVTKNPPNEDASFTQHMG